MAVRTAALLAATALTVAACDTAEEAVSGVATAAAQAAGSVVDANCKVLKPVDELSYEEAAAVYACISDDLVAGYKTGDKRWIPAEFVNDYRSWTPASTLPGNPGFHGERYLLTYVNDTGAAEYLKYEAERGPMPVGTVIAKESFGIADDGTVEPGPLFFMQKAEAGASPKTGDWYYMAVAANGTPMGVNVFRACNECHEGFADSDYLGYPIEEARIGG